MTEHQHRGAAALLVVLDPVFRQWSRRGRALRTGFFLRGVSWEQRQGSGEHAPNSGRNGREELHRVCAT